MKDEPETNWEPEDDDLLDAPIPEEERSVAASVLNKLVMFGALLFATGFAMSLLSPGVTRGATRSHQLEMRDRRESLENAIREARENGDATAERTLNP